MDGGDKTELEGLEFTYLALDRTAWKLGDPFAEILVYSFFILLCLFSLLTFGFFMFFMGFIFSLPILTWRKGFDVIVVLVLY
jgi:hypothetical protein